MKKRGIIIAIDGHSSTGKSTFAKEVAKQYGLTYIDTGALYRGITLALIREGVDFAAPLQGDTLTRLFHGLSLHFLPTGEGGAGELHMGSENIEKPIRSLEVAKEVSKVASNHKVREFVGNILQQYGAKGDVIMDGRDIGTVVFPNADLKIFMTAEPEIRAKRRYAEIVANGGSATYQEVLSNILERDRLDENREEAPLMRAPDAILLDNGNMTPEDQMVWIKKILKEGWGYCPR